MYNIIVILYTIPWQSGTLKYVFLMSNDRPTTVQAIRIQVNRSTFALYIVNHSFKCSVKIKYSPSTKLFLKGAADKTDTDY